MVRILVADDHEVVRRGSRALLEEQADWQVVAEIGDGARAVERALHLRPDVVILDISMPRLNGLDACRRIVQAWPAARVLIQTVHSEDAVARHAWRPARAGSS